MSPCLLFCNDAFSLALPDPDFMAEHDAAKAAGFTMLLFSFEILTKDKDGYTATRRIKPAEELLDIIYRGWMLKPADYTLLYNTLLSKKYRLINSPAEYQRCHYLPESYAFVQSHTAKTVWLKVENCQVNYADVFDAIEVFGQAPLIIKDYVKSQKHYWDTACFIASAADKEKVKSSIDNLIALQGDDLNEGIVIREFLQLKDIAVHPKSGMPLKQEYRLFYLHKKLLAVYDYWDEAYTTNEELPLDFFNAIAAEVQSNFFTMDIAKTITNEWTIIELGDGQVSGLPDKADINEFYTALFERNIASSQ